MEYRIIFKSRHKELHDEVGKFIGTLLQEYGVHPNFEQKEYRKSVELRIESPIDGRKSLEKLGNQEDGDVDLNKVYD